jgi:hypothetical protein
VGHPDLAAETIRRIAFKCAHHKPLDVAEQRYLANALTLILAEYEEKKGSKRIIRADRALSLVAGPGKPKETWLPRNIRIYSRVEELRRQEEKKGRKPKLLAIWQQVSEEANRGDFDSEHRRRKLSASKKYRLRNAVPSESKPQCNGILSLSAIEKIHKAIDPLIRRQEPEKR